MDELDNLKIYKDVNFYRLLVSLSQIKVIFTENNQADRMLSILANSNIQTLLYDFFYITYEMFNLSQAEGKALGNYLYANDLIIQCKKAAVRVSPQTWEAIEHRMLRVPE